MIFLVVKMKFHYIVDILIEKLFETVLSAKYYRLMSL